MNFSYTDRETDYLKSRCKRMAEVIESVGHINRKADDDLFSSVVYHHRDITPQLFERYRHRFSPCGSVASLYLWAVAGGAIPELKDYKPKKK